MVHESLLRSVQGESVTRVSGNLLTLSELVELKTIVGSSVPPVNSNIPNHILLGSSKDTSTCITLQLNWSGSCTSCSCLQTRPFNDNDT